MFELLAPNKFFGGDCSLIVPLLKGSGGFYDSNYGSFIIYSVTCFWKPSYYFYGGIFFSFYIDDISTGSMAFLFFYVDDWFVGDLPYFMYVLLSFVFLSDIVGDLGDLADSLVTCGEAN